MENIEQLIQQAADGDYAGGGQTFAEIMAAKMTDALDQERIKVSGQVYNGLEAEDEEQLEFDLEDDDSEEDDVDVDDEDDTDDSDEDTEDD
jgi:ribonuclease E